MTSDSRQEIVNVFGAVGISSGLLFALWKGLQIFSEIDEAHGVFPALVAYTLISWSSMLVGRRVGRCLGEGLFYCTDRDAVEDSDLSNDDADTRSTAQLV